MLQPSEEQVTAMRPFFVGTIAWLGLAAAVWYAFEPSLSLPPKHDQWWYLIDARGRESFFDLLANTYSWNRTRQTVRVDSELFRPVLFAILAAQKAWCGPRQELVQATGIVLHLGICVLLYSVLRRMHDLARSGAPVPEASFASRAESDGTGILPSASAILSFSATAFFALSPAHRAMVEWPHIQGYLLFDALLLATLLLVPKTAAELDRPDAARRTVAAGILLLVGAFTHEMGQLVAVLFALHAAAIRLASGRRRSAAATFALFASVAAIYQTANRLDLRHHLATGQCNPPSGRMWSTECLRRTPGNAAKLVAYSTVQPWVPGSYAVFRDRGTVWSRQTLWNDLANPGSASAERLVWFACVLVGAALLSVVAVRNLAGRSREHVAIVALCAASYVVYMAILVLGRCNVRGDFSTQGDLGYVSYFAMISSMLVVQSAVSGGLSERRGGRLVRLTLAAGLLALAAGGASRIRTETTLDVAEGAAWHRRSLALRRFVDEHDAEPDFAFEVDDPTDDLYLTQGFVSHAVQFSCWTSAAAPGTARYVVRFVGDRLVVEDRKSPPPS